MKSLSLLVSSLIAITALFYSEFKLELKVTGTVIKHSNFESKFVAPRHVEVWLPPSYEKEARSYPVLYMHDGQNVFNPKTSYTGIDWGVDEALIRLIKEGRVREVIVVAVWNSPKRVPEYMPAKALQLPGGQEAMKQFKNAEPLADKYLKFLVTELKPYIDRNYRTLKDRENTFIMGSSMGGLISLYALCEYPEVFGAAACVSTHWPAGNGIVIEYAKTALPKPGHHRIYFDFGTKTLDKDYEPYQKRMDEVMRVMGYTFGKDWVTRKFTGADHSERAWRSRVDVPLTFLLQR